MFRRTIAWMFLVIVVGCGGSERASSRLMETAAFEERQNNFAYAAKLYERVLDEYPATDAATEARRRLDAIEHGDIEALR